jgi:ribosomal protein L40E
MEIAILALLGIVVILAVVAPLFRGRDHYADEAEFSLQTTSSAARSAAAPGLASPGQLAAGAAAASPVAAAAAAASPVTEAAAVGAAALEGEVARYRDALKAGTLCSRCGEANPVDAKFCRDCGHALPASAAQEFAP